MLRLARRTCWRTSLFQRRALSTEAYSDTYDGSFNPPNLSVKFISSSCFFFAAAVYSLRHWGWSRRLRGRDGRSTNRGSDLASDAENR